MTRVPDPFASQKGSAFLLLSARRHPSTKQRFYPWHTPPLPVALLRAHQTHKEDCPTGLDGDLPCDSPFVPARSSPLPSTV